MTRYTVIGRIKINYEEEAQSPEEAMEIVKKNLMGDEQVPLLIEGEDIELVAVPHSD